MSVLGKGTEAPYRSSAKTRLTHIVSPCLVNYKEDYELPRGKQYTIRDDFNKMTLS